ncbi:MAG: hypothetical protein GY753_12270, partial [Gammaproteobacteria bacterium]|nr:hypothetical protein [Gammaproteobacteria bacterium]
EGATLGGWVKIKDDAEGCIPSGSKIRFIVGQSGQSTNSRFDNGAGGGGGTGILFLPPNANNGEWQHLIIAGGGGGGYAAVDAMNGLGGRAYPDSTSGEASVESTATTRWGRAAGWKYGSPSGAEPGWRPNYGDWADWVKVYGKFKGISVADDGTVWGVNRKNEIYRWKAADFNWENVSGTFKQVSVADDSTVWGVGPNNEIYRRKTADSVWENVSGTFKQVSVAADGTVWGVKQQ